MIKVRTKKQPNKIITYPSRKHILDLLRWDLILEIVHDDDAPVPAPVAEEPAPAPETETQEEPRRSRRRKTSEDPE